MENEKLLHNLNEKSRSLAIRVSLMERGASGPFLGLSLDEEKPQDESFHVQGLTFVVDKCLLEQCGTINIDFIEAGNDSRFEITAANPLFSKKANHNSKPYHSRGLCH